MKKLLSKIDPFLIRVSIELGFVVVFIISFVSLFIAEVEKNEIRDKRMTEMSEKYASLMPKEDHDFLFERYKVEQ